MGASAWVVSGWGPGGGGRTVSAPALFFHAIQRENFEARSSATASLVSTARWRGVSPSALREMPASSWPEEMRNS